MSEGCGIASISILLINFSMTVAGGAGRAVGRKADLSKKSESKQSLASFSHASPVNEERSSRSKWGMAWEASSKLKYSIFDAAGPLSARVSRNLQSPQRQ
jgi:hypothetical protein